MSVADPPILEPISSHLKNYEISSAAPEEEPNNDKSERETAPLNPLAENASHNSPRSSVNPPTENTNSELIHDKKSQEQEKKNSSLLHHDENPDHSHLQENAQNDLPQKTDLPPSTETKPPSLADHQKTVSPAEQKETPQRSPTEEDKDHEIVPLDVEDSNEDPIIKIEKQDPKRLKLAKRMLERINETERTEWLALGFEFFCLLTSLLCIFLFVSADRRRELWFIPLLGIAGATVAISTPAGGGIIFFPALSIAGIELTNTVGFSVATQAVGMGLFGTLNWIRCDPKAIVKFNYSVTTFFSLIGITCALFLVRIRSELFLHVAFAVLGLLLAFFIWYTLWRPYKVPTGPSIKLTNQQYLFRAASLALTGFLGGLIVGHLGVGVDTLIFFVMTAIYRSDSHKATVTSVLIMGSSAIYSFILYLFVFDSVPIDMWLMVLPGILVGARLGVYFNKWLGKTKVLIFFSILLVAEFIRTMIQVGTGQFSKK